MNNIVNINHFTRMGWDLLVETCEITPETAGRWLLANQHNRPLSKSHVVFLANQMSSGEWMLNGQPIIIGEDEQILDGQHRLYAIIESGVTVRSLVIYGVPPEAFKTIDTGKVRTGSDVLNMNYPNEKRQVVAAVATAARWVMLWRKGRGRRRIPNSEILVFAQENPEIWRCASTLYEYPRDSQVIALGAGTFLYFLFQEIDEEQAREFMHKLSTGEALKRSEVEYMLRAQLIKNASRLTAKYSHHTIMRMVIKAWNVKRSGKEAPTRQALSLNVHDDEWIKPV